MTWGKQTHKCKHTMKRYCPETGCLSVGNWHILGKKYYVHHYCVSVILLLHWVDKTLELMRFCDRIKRTIHPFVYLQKPYKKLCDHIWLRKSFNTSLNVYGALAETSFRCIPELSSTKEIKKLQFVIIA